MVRLLPFLFLLCAVVICSAGCITDADEFSVGLIVDGRSLDDPFNMQALAAFDLLAAKGYTTYVENANSAEEIRAAFSKMAEKKPDLIVGISYPVQLEFVEAAHAYPDLSFLSVDMDFSAQPKNAASVKFQAQESSFLAGYLAGMMTETNIVGVITGMDTDTIREFVYGYKAGVMYAGEARGEKITVLWDDVGSFYDVEKGRSLALAEYSKGADVVFNVAGNAGLGIISAANESGRYVIGVDVDQRYLAPDSVLASATKNIKETILLVVDRYSKGEDVSGEVLMFGVAEGSVALEGFSDVVSLDIREQITEIEDLIIMGDIVPPATEEEFAAWALSI